MKNKGCTSTGMLLVVLLRCRSTNEIVLWRGAQGVPRQTDLESIDVIIYYLASYIRSASEFHPSEICF